MRKAFWTIQKINDGFEQFRSEHGRLPKAHEVDEITYLPSSRSIQKRFGGLEALRKELGYTNLHFGKGEYRSKIASQVNGRGRKAEIELESVLCKMFGEVFVHTEKIFDSSKNRIDFYIYCPSGNFGIDIFYAETLRNLQSNVNIKMKKYTNFQDQLYLVCANRAFKQDELDHCTQSKIKPFSDNFQLVTLDRLFRILRTKGVYENPIN